MIISLILFSIGYDPNANPPNYGEPDDIIKQNTQNVQQNKEKWLNIAKNFSIHAGKTPKLPMKRFRDKDLQKLLSV